MAARGVLDEGNWKGVMTVYIGERVYTMIEYENL